MKANVLLTLVLCVIIHFTRARYGQVCMLRFNSKREKGGGGGGGSKLYSKVALIPKKVNVYMDDLCRLVWSQDYQRTVIIMLHHIVMETQTFC